MSAKVIAFINFKGGVGKTSNAVNIAACLAKYHHKRVLIVDLDAQCNASFCLLDHRERERVLQSPKKSVCQIYRDYVMGTKVFDFDESVLRGIPRSPEGNPHLPTLDLLPSAVELMEIEDQIESKYAQPVFTWLERELKDRIKGYDYVLLDCPPNVYTVTKSALYFADHYFISYIPDFLSLSGFRIFARVVKSFQEKISGYKPKHFHSKIAGVIVNRYKQVGNVYTVGMNQLRLEMTDLKEQGLLHAKAVILEPPIRDCVAVAECTDHHLPVILYREHSNGSQDYAALTESFLTQLNSLE